MCGGDRDPWDGGGRANTRGQGYLDTGWVRAITFMREIRKDLSANIAIRGATGPYQALHGPKKSAKGSNEVLLGGGKSAELRFLNVLSAP